LPGAATDNPADLDLDRIVAAWAGLPAPIKVAVLALVGSAGK
jgi:hypothetical protein